MKTFTHILKHLLMILVLTFCFCTVAHAEVYWFELNTSYSNNKESATLTAEDSSGRTVWTYRSGAYPAGELSNFSLILKDYYVYLVENGAIKSFDFYTGRVKWTNYDFQGSPASGCYTFSSSGKLYISGYYGPDLFVVDTDGRTLCRVNELTPGSYWPDGMWWSGGDNLSVHYYSNSKTFTFNVLNYFGRKDGIY